MTTPGNHKIRTSSGKYLTLSTQAGTVTALPATGGTNQVWDFQSSGTSWTIRNTGYAATAYAYSTGQDAAAVTGSTSSTEWTIVPYNGVLSIQLGSNLGNAWNVGTNDQVTLQGTQLQNAGQQFSIE